MANHGIVITGATATGKTALAVAVARAVGGEIISMDSRQVYRGMDIGTAKATAAERQGVPHHGLDLVSPAERYNAGRFARDARRWIDEIRARGHVPILAGGTGFFLKALTTPLFEEPAVAEGRRESLKRYLADLPLEELERWAGRLEPAALERGGGRQRLARAVEVALLTGRPLGWWHRHAAPGTGPVPLSIFVLDMPRAALHERINTRVSAMLDAGLVEEVCGLLDRGCTAADPGMNATGYIELMPHIRGDLPLEQAAGQIRAATRKYARRQDTWFRHQLPAGAHRLDATLPTSTLVDTVLQAWDEEGEGDR
jgi:tRNA dimethylallyltransferase